MRMMRFLTLHHFHDSLYINTAFWFWVWVSNHPLPLLLIMTMMTRRPDTTHVLDLASYWRETGGNFTTIPQVFIFRLITINLPTQSLWLPSLLCCHYSEFFLVLCRAWVRDSGVREGFPVWLSREEALLSAGMLNLLSLDFSHSLANLIYQTDNFDTTWTNLLRILNLLPCLDMTGLPQRREQVEPLRGQLLVGSHWTGG